MSEPMQSRKDKINSKDITEIFLFSLFDSSIMSQIVERVCIVKFSIFNNFSLVFTYYSTSNFFCSRFLRIVVYGSVVCYIFFITFFIFDRYDSCSRSNTHGAKLSPGVINI